MNNLKEIPKFATEEDERAFWEVQDSTDYVDWAKATAVSLPKFKPSTKTVLPSFQRRFSQFSRFCT